MPTSNLRRLASRAAIAGALLVPSAALAGDGVLGVFFDTNGRECSGNVPTASFATLHVLLLAQGATFGGITGAEFRIDTAAAQTFLFRAESAPSDAIVLGSALGSGVNIAFPTCQTSGTTLLLSFQVYATGSPTRDVTLRVTPKSQPSNPAFSCPLAVQCDEPTWTSVCVEGSSAILNPTGTRPCGASRIDSQWSVFKDLYRP